MKKWPTNNPVARIIPLIDATPVDIEVEPGLMHVICRRGELDDSTLAIVSLLRDRSTGAIDETSAAPLELFVDDQEDMFCTTGDIIRVTRTYAGAVSPVPALSLSLIHQGRLL